MTLSDRIAAVMARVSADVAGTTFAEGAREEATHRAPPFVLWKRTRATAVGAAQLDDLATPYARAITGKAQGFQVRLWGADWPAVDALFEALVRALEHEAAGAWSYQGDTALDVGATAHGEAIVVDLTLRAHVAEAASATVVLTSAHVRRSTAAASGDGALEPGDP